MKTFKKSLLVQIDVAQDSEFKSDSELLEWVALCLNCNTNNREVVVTSQDAGHESDVDTDKPSA